MTYHPLPHHWILFAIQLLFNAFNACLPRPRQEEAALQASARDDRRIFLFSQPLPTSSKTHLVCTVTPKIFTLKWERVRKGLEYKETAQFPVLVLFNKLFLQISPMQTKDDAEGHPSHKPLSHSRGLQMPPPPPVPELLPVSPSQPPLDKLHTLC